MAKKSKSESASEAAALLDRLSKSHPPNSCTLGLVQELLRGRSQSTADAAQLYRMLSETSSIHEWRAYIAEHPPSADAIAYLLIFHEQTIRAEEASTTARKDRARTAAARDVIAAKRVSGGTKKARAIAMLEDRQRRGENLMEPHITAQLARKLDCSPRLVALARAQVLARK